VSPTILKSLDDVSGSIDHASVCLTFDDGPDPAFTPRILDVLAEHRVRATFFVLGQAAEENPALVERMIRDGHTVGNHTFHHHHPWTIRAATAREEVRLTSERLKQITGSAPLWFRPPHGRLRRAMLQQVDRENMKTVLWTRSAIDWGPLGTDEGIAERLGEVHAGDIVLMHDGERKHNKPGITARQLPVLLERLQRRGIRPLTLDQAARPRPTKTA